MKLVGSSLQGVARASEGWYNVTIFDLTESSKGGIPVKCPECAREMTGGYLYVRGTAACLFWGAEKKAKFYSQKGLELIDLTRLSLVRPSAQAILEASRCPGCGIIAFKSRVGQ